MKKARNCISAKKSNLLKHQTLFTPYHIDWNDPSCQDVPARDHSKTFFNTMKNELMSIKCNVENLIRKDSTEGISNLLSNSALKPENTCQKKQPQGIENTYLAQNEAIPDKLSNEKLQIQPQRFMKQKDRNIQKLLKQLKIQKSLIHQLKSENKELHQQIAQKKQLLIEFQKQEIILKEAKSQINRLVIEKKQLQQSSCYLSEHKILFEDSINILNQEVSLLAERFKAKDEEVSLLAERFNAKDEEVQQLTESYQFLVRQIEELLKQFQLTNQQMCNVSEQANKLEDQGQNIFTDEKYNTVPNASIKKYNNRIKTLITKLEQQINYHINRNAQLNHQIINSKRINQKLKIQQQQIKQKLSMYDTKEQHTIVIQNYTMHKKQQRQSFENMRIAQKARKGLCQGYSCAIFQLNTELKNGKQSTPNYEFNKIFTDDRQGQQLLQAVKQELQLLRQQKKQAEYQCQLLQTQLAKQRIKNGILQSKNIRMRELQESLPVQLRKDRYNMGNNQESLTKVIEHKNQQIRIKDSIIKQLLQHKAVSQNQSNGKTLSIQGKAALSLQGITKHLPAVLNKENIQGDIQ